MTNAEAKKILEAYIACESKKAHFKCDDDNCDDNCHLLYEMGTVGEYNEAINIAIQALEQEPQTGHWIEKMDACECPYCHKAWDYFDNDTEDFDYCPKCGAKMDDVPDTNIGNMSDPDRIRK